MKLVKCVIRLPDKSAYVQLVQRLLDIYMSHTAVFEAPRSFTVTCHCSTIQAETNLDAVLSELALVAEKRPIMGDPQPAPQLQGPPAPLMVEGVLSALVPVWARRAAA